MSRTFVAVDNESLHMATACAGRADRIVTAFPEGEPHPALGFAPVAGSWFVASWSPTQPCGCWTVGEDGKATCRVPKET